MVYRYDLHPELPSAIASNLARDRIVFLRVRVSALLRLWQLAVGSWRILKHTDLSLLNHDSKVSVCVALDPPNRTSLATRPWPFALAHG